MRLKPLRLRQTRASRVYKKDSKRLRIGQDTRVDGSSERQLRYVKPTYTDFAHPNKLDYENGLYKYAMGVFELPRNLWPVFQVKAGSMKVFSDREPPTSWKKRFVQYISDISDGEPPHDLSTSLNRICNVASRAFHPDNRVQFASVQLFQMREHLRTMKLSTSFLSSHERSWNLICHLHRDSGPGLALTRPYFTFQFPHLIPEKWCKIGGSPLARGSAMSFRVCGHMKAQRIDTKLVGSRLTQREVRDWYDGPLQTLADGLRMEAARSMTGRSFPNANAALAAVTSGLIDHLMKSPLANLVDFDYLMAECVPGKQDERFIFNTLLNPDGSAKSPLKSIETPSSQLLESSQLPESLHRSSEDSEHRSTHQLSSKVAQKVGLDEAHIIVDTSPEIGNRPTDLDASQIAREFDRLCDDLDATGLACWAIATEAISQQISSVASDIGQIAVLESGKLPFKTTFPITDRDAKLPRLERHASYELRAIVSTMEPRIRIQLPMIIDLPVMDNNSKLRSMICRIQLTSTYNKDEDDSTMSEDPLILLPAEVGLLTQICLSVLERLCLSMKFESTDSALEIFAEALLRTVRFSSTVLILEEVFVTLGHMGSLRSLSATRTGSGLDHLPVYSSFKELRDRETDRQMGTIKNDDMDVSQLDSSAGNSGDVAIDPMDRTQTDRAATALSSSNDQNDATESSEDVAATKTNNQTPRKTPGPPLITFSSQLVPMPRDLARRTGIEDYKYYLQRGWRSEDSMAISTREAVETGLEAAMDSNTPMRMRWFRESFESILGKIESYGRFTLHFPLSPGHNPDCFEVSKRSFFAIRLDAEDLGQHKARRVEIQSPWFVRLLVSFGAGKPRKRTPMQLRFSLIGPSSAIKDAESGGDLHSQMKFVSEQFNGLIEPLLQRLDFADIDQLTKEVRSEVMSQRQLFESLLDVEDVVVDARHHIMSRSAHFDLSSAMSSVPVKPARIDEAEDLEHLSENDDIEHRNIVSPSRSSTEIVKVTDHDRFEEIDGDKRMVDRSETDGNDPSLSEFTGIFVALGSNLGDRVENIEKACRELDAEPDIRVLRTSPLYETKPMYVEDQNLFLNGVCQVGTTLGPTELLDKLQAIEQRLGRVKMVDKGPRNIDLDILLYNREQVNTERLIIPHPLMLEREFVLRPLCNMGMMRNGTHPGSMTHTYKDYLKKVALDSQPMYSITPISPAQPYMRRGGTDAQESTRVMSILNVTPDSFSDGGVNQPTNLECLKTTVASHIASGATIIDIGGQSSRPNAADVTTEEEIARIIPAIEAIKSLPEASGIAISVDTYRAVVAEAAVKAGAHIINDISAGQLDPDMLDAIARLGCTYVMMHMRGSPATMQNEENCAYPGGLAITIKRELEARIEAAQAAGIRRWRLILDPGIGFSKTPEHNLEILRDFGLISGFRRGGMKRILTHFQYPWLFGASRKSFIGKFTNVQEPRDRAWGTAAAVTASIGIGADIVRVHDVKEMATVAKMADAIYRC